MAPTEPLPAVDAPAPRLILASASAARRAILAEAEISFEVMAADIDEDAIAGRLIADRAAPPETAMALAAHKAVAVSSKLPGAVVIGADQVLALADVIFDKPKSRAQARAQLVRLRGRTHSLLSAVCTARDGAVMWRHLAHARLAMRPFSEAVLEDHLGSADFWTAGLYRIESRSVQLFSAIDGDYFGILGLPLLPLLAHLRELELVAT